MYYVNRFDEPGGWVFAVWEIKKVYRHTRMGRQQYQWVKKIYDPEKVFKIGYILDLSGSVIKKNEHEVIKELFEKLPS